MTLDRKTFQVQKTTKLQLYYILFFPCAEKENKYVSRILLSLFSFGESALIFPSLKRAAQFQDFFLHVSHINAGKVG